MAKIDYLTKDYEGFREDMINSIPRLLEEWTDHSSSDAGIVILELLSYGLDIVSYYQDRVANETLLPTATQLRSVLDNTQLIGYRLSNPVPSKVDLVFKVTKDQEVTVPSGFRVSTEPEEIGEDGIVFETNISLVIPEGYDGTEKENGEYKYKVSATQGRSIVNEIYSSDGSPSQEFTLKYPNVIDGTIELMVDEGSGFSVWKNVTDEMLQISEDGNHYWVGVNEAGLSTIEFGDGFQGNIPDDGSDNIRISYRVGGGRDTNVGTNTITKLKTSLSGIKEVKNPNPATGGRDRETMEQAKKNAPLSLRTMRRAVNREDFQNIAKEHENVLASYAERDEETPNQVNVYLIIEKDADIGEVVNVVNTTLDGLKLITTEVTVSKGKEVEADIKIKLKTEKDEEKDVIKGFVEDLLEGQFDPLDREFGEGIKLFKIYSWLGDIRAILDIDIQKFTIFPKTIDYSISGSYNINIETEKELDKEGIWKIEMDNSSDFTVYFDEDGEFDGGEQTIGSGSLNNEFSDSGITFTLEGEDLKENDYIKFKTQKGVGDIAVEDDEFLQLGKLEVEVEAIE